VTDPIVSTGQFRRTAAQSAAVLMTAPQAAP